MAICFLLNVPLPRAYPLPALRNNSLFDEINNTEETERARKVLSEITTDEQKDIFQVLESKVGFDLVVKWINKYPNLNRDENVEEIKDFLEFLKNPDNRKGDFITEAFRRFPVINKMQEDFKEAFIDLSKPVPAAVAKEELFRKFIKGPIVADVGCGWNVLGREILINNPHVKKVIGCDLEEQMKRELPKGVSFRLMENPLNIPIEDDLANSVILSFVLHHIEVDTEQFLKEVKRVLSADGYVFVLEDTFSSFILPEYDDNELSNLFFALRDSGKRLLCLEFIDWFNHNFINRSRAPLVPGNYKSIEDWEEIFQRSGFRIVESRHFGFFAIGSKNPVNRGFFVLGKEIRKETQTKASSFEYLLTLKTIKDKL
ncbi:MAG: class I SAM-dependent methyltransferase [Proteobacteria bacterium]|nr:class I SAM-dependent methyltransferase [Pseudomonadota bacterium]